MLKLWRFRWRFQEILWRILALFGFNFGAVAEKNLATLSENNNKLAEFTREKDET